MIVELDVSATIDGHVVLQEVRPGTYCEHLGEHQSERSTVYRWTPDQADALVSEFRRAITQARPTHEAIMTKQYLNGVAGVKDQAALADVLAARGMPA